MLWYVYNKDGVFVDSVEATSYEGARKVVKSKFKHILYFKIIPAVTFGGG